jgi:hypothetical protein
LGDEGKSAKVTCSLGRVLKLAKRVVFSCAKRTKKQLLKQTLGGEGRGEQGKGKKVLSFGLETPNSKLKAQC